MPGRRNDMARHRVLIVEDEFLLAWELANELRLQHFEVAGTAATVAAGLRLARAERLDAAILDMNVRGQSVEELIRLLLADRVPVVFVTGYSLRKVPSWAPAWLRFQKPISVVEVVRALRAALGSAPGGDASGRYAPAGALAPAPRQADLPTLESRGEPGQEVRVSDMTERELQVLAGLAEGLSNKRIGNRLDIAEGTVKAHMKSILRKIGARNRTQGAVWAVANGLTGADAVGTGTVDPQDTLPG